MSKKGIEKRHSETAIFAALYRAIANKEHQDERFGSDDLARHFLPAHFKFFIKFKIIRANAKAKFKKFMPGMYEFVLARTAFFDGIFTDALDKNIPQIVMLGAGYDSRAYRFANSNNGTQIIELDAPTTQTRKKKCLKKARIGIPKQVTLAPIDFNKESLEEVLTKAGYKTNEKTLFMWEGVSYYLEPESVDATLEFVKDFSHAQSVIAFDYTVSVSEENINDYYGAKEVAQSMQKYHQAESFRFNIGEAKIESFLEQRGLTLTGHMNSTEIEKAFLLNTNRSEMGRVNGLFRFAMASPDTGPQNKQSR